MKQTAGKKNPNILIFLINLVLTAAIIAVFFFNMSNYQKKLQEQNIDDITNINQASANISSAFFLNQQNRLADAVQYISLHNFNVNDAVSYICDANSDVNSSYELISKNAKGYAAVTKDAGFAAVDYSSADYAVLKKLFTATDTQDTTIKCTPEFTDQYTASKSFALYQHLKLSDGNIYTLMAVYKSSGFAGLIELTGGYQDISTSLINISGDYIFGSSSFKSDNLFKYFYDYSELTLDEKNAELEAFASESKNVFYFKDSEYRDCVYITAPVKNTEWYCVTCVPLSSFRSSRMDMTFIISLSALLLGMMIFNVLWMKHVNMQLRTSVAREMEASAAKTDFLSRMSHDIRTPLNVINGSVVLAEKEKNPEATARYLNHIEQSSKFLSSLVNDILDLNKVESGKMELHPEPYSMLELKNSLSAIIDPLCQEKGLSFQISGFDSPEQYLLDPVRTSQIFFNLLSNAVKFTPSGGHIGMECTATDTDDGRKQLTFRVYDDGEGMSREFQNHMYETFAQENRSSDSTIHGTGLGLAIVHNLIKLMKGTISVESEVDQGTVYHITLIVDKTEKTSADHQPLISLDILKGRNVLLCEDNMINAEIAATMLKDKGMTVTHAINGRIGVDLFTQSAENSFDIILMDIQMPVLDGISAAREIRSLARKDSSEVPIIAMTANAYDTDVQNCLKAGMNGHISKPIDPPVMYQTIAEHLK